ncbi:MAG: hypothetical protein HC915_20780 [Anaerolineae bacterium]|nr:hypothetical protein [Anaerolineae bacterium]
MMAQRSATARPAGFLSLEGAALPEGGRWVEAFSGQQMVVQSGGVVLPALPQGGTVWVWHG